MLDIPLSFKDWVHNCIKSHSLFLQSYLHLEDNCGFLACMALSACHEVSCTLQANAVFELRVHLLAEKSGFNDLQESSVCGFGLGFGFVCALWVRSARVYRLHRLIAAQSDHSPLLLLFCSPS